MQRSELTKLELYKKDGCCYLRAECEVEDDRRLQKYTIPKIVVPTIGNLTINSFYTREYPGSKTTIDIGFGELEVLKGPDDYYYKCETIKEYPQKMTLEEIEKELGYKVELVSGK